MANPFPNRFDSQCDKCGETIFQDDSVYAFEDEFYCEYCAEEMEIVCPECGGFKKPTFEFCFDCNQGNIDTTPPF